MPTTTAGTDYTVHSATSGGQSIYWGVADDKEAAADLPVVLYCHGAGGAGNQFATLAAWKELREWLIDNGWAWIEATGGGGQPWGNPASETAYSNAFAYVDGQLDIQYVVVLGRSMGGAVGARLYLNHRATDPRWVGFISNSGVQDLVWAYDWDGGRWTSAFNTAWGVTSKAQFEAAVAGLNPVDGDPADWDGTNVLQMWGTADDTVDPTANAIAMRTMYAGHPDNDLSDIRAGGDHSSTNGSYLQVAAMTVFLSGATGGGWVPEPGNYIHVTGVVLRTASGWSQVTFEAV